MTAPMSNPPESVPHEGLKLQVLSPRVIFWFPAESNAGQSSARTPVGTTRPDAVVFEPPEESPDVEGVDD